MRVIRIEDVQRISKIQSKGRKLTKTDLVWLQKTLGSDTAIASNLNVCPRTVLNWRKRHGIRSIYFKNELRNMQILKLHKKGWDFERIARKVDLSGSHVRTIIRKGG